MDEPGGGKAQRACAALCLRGSVPPMLVTREAGGRETFDNLVTSEAGAAHELAVPSVGNSVEVTGRVERRDDMNGLLVPANGVRRP